MNLTVCLLTCGEETTTSCLDAIDVERKTGKFNYQEVCDVTPAYKALNRMFLQCSTDYLVPLDADMILYPGYLQRIRSMLRGLNGDRGWHSILFPLWDKLTQEKILALKVFNMAAMRHIPYRDDPCPDILHYQEMEDEGLRCVNLFHEEPIGDHVVTGNFFCYAKYRDLYMVHRTHPQSYLPQHFKGGKDIKERAYLHFQFFMKQFQETGNQDYRYCLAGMVEGLTAPKRYASKDLGNRRMEVSCDEAEERFHQWYRQNKSDRIHL